MEKRIIDLNTIEENIDNVVCPVCDGLLAYVTKVADETPAQAAVENFNGGFIAGAQYVLAAIETGKLLNDMNAMRLMFVEMMGDVLEMHKRNHR